MRFAPIRFGLILATVLIGTSCGCLSSTNTSTACLVERQIVDCTTGNVATIGPIAADILSEYLAGGGAPDWTTVESELEDAAVSDVGCILSHLEDDFLTPGPQPTSLPVSLLAAHLDMSQRLALATDVSSHFASWKVAHQIGEVGFKIKTHGGQIVVH